MLAQPGGVLTPRQTSEFPATSDQTSEFPTTSGQTSEFSAILARTARELQRRFKMSEADLRALALSVAARSQGAAKKKAARAARVEGQTPSS